MKILHKKWLRICEDKISLAFSLSTAIGFALMIAFIIYGFQTGIFISVAAFSGYIKSLGPAAPIAFIFIQAVQVIIPILPGAIGCAAGVVAFGGPLGFLYSYIGICIGSFIAFLLAKRYGLPVVRKLVNPKSLAKYMKWLETGSKFDIMFAIAIFSPIAPDDLLCYLAGLTPISIKKFVLIILLGKPASIALYSFGLLYLSSFIHIFI